MKNKIAEAIQAATQEWFDENTEEKIKKLVKKRLDEKLIEIQNACLGFGYSFGRYEVTHKAQFESVFKTYIQNVASEWSNNIPAPSITPTRLKLFQKTINQEIDYEVERHIRQSWGLDENIKLMIDEEMSKYTADKIKEAVSLIKG
jgi:hypothetical protein